MHRRVAHPNQELREGLATDELLDDGAAFRQLGDMRQRAGGQSNDGAFDQDGGKRLAAVERVSSGVSGRRQDEYLRFVRPDVGAAIPVLRDGELCG